MPRVPVKFVGRFFRLLKAFVAIIAPSLAIDGANRHDSKMVQTTIESIAVERPEPTEKETQGMPLDKACDSGEVRDWVKEFGYTAHVRARGEEAQAIKHEAGFKARRWVVERTHSWMNRFPQRDPSGHIDGMNLYEYRKSNPLIGLDPMGQIAARDAEHKPVTMKIIHLIRFFLAGGSKTVV